jgi:hypothetical protein
MPPCVEAIFERGRLARSMAVLIVSGLLVASVVGPSWRLAHPILFDSVPSVSPPPASVLRYS